MLMLRADRLSCQYNDQLIFNQVSFKLLSGDVLHIQGPNGSGKSSLLRIIAGLRAPRAGELFWFEQTIQRSNDNYQQQIAYLGHRTGLKMDLTVTENVHVLNQLYTANRYWDIEALLLRIGLADYADHFLKTLSAGQQQRLALAVVFALQRPLWILDEPLTALDQQAKQLLEEYMLTHCQQGGAIILTAHQDWTIPGLGIQRLELTC